MQIKYSSLILPIPSINKSLSLYMLIYIIITNIQIINSITYTVTQQFFTDQFSDNDITLSTNPWTIGGVGIPTYKYFTNCSNKQLLGGYQILSGDATNPAYIQKTWSNLPPHYQANIQLKIYKIDSWNNNNLFIMVDGISIQIQNWTTSTGTTDICGNPNPYITVYNPQFNQYIYQFNKTISHFSSSLTLKLISTLSSWEGSWGIRQVAITLAQCHYTCLTCTNSTMCVTCDTGNGLVLVGLFCECGTAGYKRLIVTNCPVTQCVSCVLSCPAIGYYTMNVSSCASCSPACNTCTGPSSLSPNCLTCSSANGYIDPGTGICTVCYGNCATCTGLLFNQCTSCNYGTYLYTNTCISICPATTYPSQSTKLCIACTSPCITCIGNTNNYCLSCIATYYLYITTCYSTCPYSMYGYNGNCISSCPIATYPDITSIPICINCPQYCDTCDSTGICTSCAVNSYFSPYDNLCHNPCPFTYYADNSTKICTKCDNSCLTCFGPTSQQCYSCYPSTYLVISVCYSVCPAHTYSLTCLLCHSSCLNCSGPSQYQCLNCNHFYMFYINTSSCVQSCNLGDIANNTAMTCLTCTPGYVGHFDECILCYSNCQTCNGIYYDNCQTCVSTAIHSPYLIYYFNTILDINNIVYKQYINTCIYSNTYIIYMPNLYNTSQTIYKTLLYIVVINIAITVILQLFYKYKTNLLLTIETMQLLSYLYYFATPFSESNQIILILLYHAHPTAIITMHHIFPKLKQIIDYGYYNYNLFTKAMLMERTTVFIQDTFYLHIIMGGILVIFIICRFLPKEYMLYAKINPYLVTYSFRILFMELALSMILFFTYITLIPTIMKISLAFVIVDLLIIAVSFFWKIRTQHQPDHAHYALFYFNQLGPRKSHTHTHSNSNINSNKNIKGYQQLQLQQTQQQKQKQKQRKSILPSLLYYISRIPLIITIILFHNQPLTQSICILIYSIFLFGLNAAIEYRRRIYKFMTLWVYGGFMLCSAIMVMIVCGINANVYFDYLILGIFIGLLACTVGQIVSNYMFWLSIYQWVLAKYFGCSRN